MAHKIQDELDQVERQVYVLEKEENELRRVRNKKSQPMETLFIACNGERIHSENVLNVLLYQCRIPAIFKVPRVSKVDFHCRINL